MFYTKVAWFKDHMTDLEWPFRGQIKVSLNFFNGTLYFSCHILVADFFKTYYNKWTLFSEELSEIFWILFSEIFQGPPYILIFNYNFLWWTRPTFQFEIVLDLNLVIFLRDTVRTLLFIHSQDTAHQLIHLVLLLVPHRSAGVNPRKTILTFVLIFKGLVDSSNV